LTTHLQKTILSEKMIEDDLSRVEESAKVSPAWAHFLLIVVLVVDCVRNPVLFLSY
jgi:hypothetical protein